MPTDAIAIVRVSTAGQATEDRGGLDGQRATIAKIASDHDLRIVREVALTISGTRVLDDARFLGVLTAIESPQIGGVVVSELDRLMRPDDPAYYAIFGRFRATGTILYTAEGAQDFRRDRLLMMMRSEIAAWERERFRERSMRGKEVLRRRGVHVAGPEGLPYGVAWSREEGWSYRWPEAGIARQVYERVLAGEGNFSALARELGITRTLVRRILANPIYAGVRRIAHRYSGHRATLRAPEDVIEQTVLAPPLVPLAWWEAVQPALGRRAQVRRDSPCLYRGLAWCATCRLPMHAHHDVHGREGRWGYRCRSAAKGRSCGVGWLKREAVEAAADAAIVAHVARPEVLAEALRASLEPVASAATNPVAVARAVAQLERERERVLAAYERGLRTLAAAEARSRAIDAEIRDLGRAAAARQQVQGSEGLARRIAAPFAAWDLLSSDQRRRLAQASIRSLDVAREGVARARIVALRLRIGPAPDDPPSWPTSSDLGRLWGLTALEVTCWQ